MTLCAPVQGMPGSVWLDCGSGVGGGVALESTLFNGLSCDGGVYSGVDGSQYAVQMPPCSPDTGYITSMCAANYEPASLSPGVRFTTYVDSPTCLGSPFSYADTYNYGPNAYVCEDGDVELVNSAVDPPQVTVFQEITCAGSAPVNNATTSVGWGCISAMPSLTQRTFLEWQVVQAIDGMSATAIDDASNVIALVTAMAKLYEVDYNVITDVNVVLSDSKAGSGNVRSGVLDLGADESAINVAFTLMGQPGFGNSYTMSDMYPDLVNLHKTALMANCSTAPTGCFYTMYKALATTLGVPSASQGTGFASAVFSAPTTVVNPTYPQADTSSNNANTPSSGGNGLGGGAIFGIVAGALIAIAAGYYYCVVQRSKQHQGGYGGDQYVATNSFGDVDNPVRGNKY